MTPQKLVIVSFLSALAGGLVVLALLAALLPRLMPRMMSKMAGRMKAEGNCSPDL